MTTDELNHELNYVNHSRENRLKYANMAIAKPELIPKMLDILFMVDDKVSCRAGWVLEFMCSEQLEAIIPFLNRFTDNIHNVHLDSAQRPIAKVCELLAKAYSNSEADICVDSF